jgi:GDP-L-fucose synthase
VLITGGSGFIGTNIIIRLVTIGCKEIIYPTSREFNLTREDEVARLLDQTRPDIVIHLAGLVGGILANKERPADYFYRNITMGTFIIHHSCLRGVKKLVAAGAGCGYPEYAPTPLKESSFWDGPPQPESAPYSLAKRMLHVQAQAYFRQYNFKSVIVVPGNVYGPYDNFNLYQSHVIPALVSKFVEAIIQPTETVEVWGSGKPSRDFVHVDDVVEGILLAAKKCETPELINISSGMEHTIQQIVDLLVELTGFKGKVVWNMNRPDGQKQRRFDITKARSILGYQPGVSLRDGLNNTINWYRENRDKLVDGRLRQVIS